MHIGLQAERRDAGCGLPGSRVPGARREPLDGTAGEPLGETAEAGD